MGQYGSLGDVGFGASPFLTTIPALRDAGVAQRSVDPGFIVRRRTQLYEQAGASLPTPTGVPVGAGVHVAYGGWMPRGGEAWIRVNTLNGSAAFRGYFIRSRDLRQSGAAVTIPGVRGLGAYIFGLGHTVVRQYTVIRRTNLLMADSGPVPLGPGARVTGVQSPREEEAGYVRVVRVGSLPLAGHVLRRDLIQGGAPRALRHVLGLGANTQIDPAVPGIISSSGTAAGNIFTGIADVFRASHGEGGGSSEAEASGADAFIDPGAGSSFFESTGGKVVVIGGIALALLATALILIPKKKSAAAVANRRRNRGRSRRRNSAMCGWDVYLRGKKITTVFFVCDMTADEVKRSLVDHDGENPAITVRRALKANRRRNARRTRLQELQELLPANWVVKTYSPGDGVTRYRFFENPVVGQSYFGPANGRYTALGMKEAMSFAYGLRRN